MPMSEPRSHACLEAAVECSSTANRLPATARPCRDAAKIDGMRAKLIFWRYVNL